MIEPSDLLSKWEINRCFDALSPLIRQRSALPAEPGSDFALDAAQISEPSMIDSAWLLRFVALDHMESLRDMAAFAPEGMSRWHVHAPWTQLRAALEAASQLVWMIGPDDRDTRLQRLLRFTFDDLGKYKLALDLTHYPGKRADLDQYERMRKEYEAAAAPWTGTAANGIRTEINLVECVIESANLSKVVRLPRTAELSWRIAAGYAHGRPWAHLTTGKIVELGRIDEHTVQVAASINLPYVRMLATIATGTIQYADYLIHKRSGRDARLEMFAFVEE